MTQETETLFKLLRVALGNEKEVSLPNDVDWEMVFNLSVKQGIVNIAYDGLQTLMDAHPNDTFGFDNPEMENLRYKWIGYGMCAEQKYNQYVQTIADLAGLYSSRGYKMLLLKGYGLSLYYPIPAHRPTGDIDIVVFDKEGRYAQQEADAFFNSNKGFSVTKSRMGHHSHFHYNGSTVENHYEFSNTYRGVKRNHEFEELLKSICPVGMRESKMNGNTLYLPSPTLNALFLMWHMATHFYSSEITLRQVCDWVQFIDKEYDSVDWELVKPAYNKRGMGDFARAIDRLAVKYFGIKKKVFAEYSELDDNNAEKIVDDIINPRVYSSFFTRFFRYYKEGWKYKLAFQSNWFKSLLNSVIVHLFHRDDMKEKNIDEI